ncbi:MAG TPA: hypothetical protein VE861_05815 [Gemmatimonadaceae bacterium]|nr:hypothetical protein [Gemmatimonadaceae bacterium]
MTTMPLRHGLIIAAACAFSPVRAMAQAPDTLLDRFTMRAESLSARFADRRAAMDDGYRRLGTDFPGMGEHWLHGPSLISGQLDAAHPTLLSYVTIGGKATLVGIGFVVTTRGSDAVTGVPGWPHAWHEHSGLFADESGARAGQHDARAAATRVWVMHAWTRLPNAAGRYQPDNWALPFARVGLTAPVDRTVDADAGRALSLASGGDRYLIAALTDAGIVGQEKQERVQQIVSTARRGVDADIAAAHAAERTLDVDRLRRQWQVMASELRALLGAGADAVLATPHAAHVAGHRQ